MTDVDVTGPVTTAEAPPTPVATRSVGLRLLEAFGTIGPLPLLVAGAFLFFAIRTDTFATWDNIASVGQQSVFLLLMACAQMVVLISGGFDMSVSAVVTFTSILSSTWMLGAATSGRFTDAGAVLVGLAVALAGGLVVGLVNGLVVAVLRINPFIATLATGTVLGGITLIYSGGLEVSGLPDLYSDTIGGGDLGPVPWLVVLAVPVVVVLLVVMNRTSFGMHLYGIGDNPVAARLAGVRVTRLTVLAYVLAGVLVAYAAWLLTARVGSGQPALGGSYTMQSITAAVIGGVSLRGGRGGVMGTVFGVIFIQMLSNGMNLMRLDTNAQSIAIGAALVVAVLIDRLRDRARARSSAWRRLQVGQ